MNQYSVTVSPKYQVVIPRKIREIFAISPGEKLQVVPYASRIELVPVKKMKTMRGFLKGMNTSVVRDKDRL